VKDSFEIIDKLADINIDINYCLISLDVISLFINVSIELILNSIYNRWLDILRDCNILKNEFVIA